MEVPPAPPTCIETSYNIILVTGSVPVGEGSLQVVVLAGVPHSHVPVNRGHTLSQV